jgi:hypothetical protein
VTFNTINEACAGILQGGTPNTLGGGSLFGLIPLPGANTFYNDATTVLAGDVCTVAPKPGRGCVYRQCVVAGSGRYGFTMHPTPVR